MWELFISYCSRSLPKSDCKNSRNCNLRHKWAKKEQTVSEQFLFFYELKVCSLLLCCMLFNIQFSARNNAHVIAALWEAKAGKSLETGSLRPAWPIWWNPVSTKNTKISWAWWQEPVIPAPLEAEAGELLKPGRQRLQWTESVPLHSSLGNKSETPS